MKVTSSLLTALAMTMSVDADKSTPLRKTERALQNNNYYNGNQYNGYNMNQYQNGQGGQQAQGYNNGNMYGGYENMEEYLRAQMAARTFSFTGCSTVQGNYGMSTFVTYRLCQDCSNNRGCGNGNGDYIVSMQEFSETYREYYQEMTGQDGSPFECMRLEEFQENYYMYGGGNGQQYNGYNGAQQQQYQGNQQYYQNGQQQDANQYYYNNNGQNNGQNQELFIGPACDGSSGLKLGVFYNEWCTYPAEGVSVKDVLGYNPENNFNMDTCISCTSSYNYNNNGGGEAEINPLCERLLERSGRCDRNEQQQTDFDAFWQDVVEFVNGGGSFEQADGYDEYYDQNAADGYQDEYGNNNGYWYQGQQNYQGQQQNMNYYQYQSSNTCDMIDSLPHMQSSRMGGGSWYNDMKASANNNGISTGALIVIIFAGIATVCVVGFMLFGWFARKSVEAVGSVASMASGESQTPYRRESDEKQPAVLA